MELVSIELHLHHRQAQGEHWDRLGLLQPVIRNLSKETDTSTVTSPKNSFIGPSPDMQELDLQLLANS